MNDAIDMSQLFPDSAESLEVSSSQRLAWELAMLSPSPARSRCERASSPWTERAQDEQDKSECSCCCYPSLQHGGVR